MTWSGSGRAPLIEVLRKAAQMRTVGFGPARQERAAEWSVTPRGPGGGHCGWNLAVQQACRRPISEGGSRQEPISSQGNGASLEALSSKGCDPVWL